METIFASILLSLSTNIDNFAVGVAYGVKNLTIPFSGSLLIALLSGISTYASMSLGDWLNHFIAPSIAQAVGSGALMMIGGLTILQLLLKPSENHLSRSQNSQSDLPESLNLKGALILGLALTLTNFGTGISAGIVHLSILLTSALSFLSSLLLIGVGAWLGQVVTSQFSGSRLEWLSGAFLIALGLYEFLIP